MHRYHALVDNECISERVESWVSTLSFVVKRLRFPFICCQSQIPGQGFAKPRAAGPSSQN